MTVFAKVKPVKFVVNEVPDMVGIGYDVLEGINKPLNVNNDSVGEGFLIKV
jgi:hypothetical protein